MPRICSSCNHQSPLLVIDPPYCHPDNVDVYFRMCRTDVSRGRRTLCTVFFSADGAPSGLRGPAGPAGGQPHPFKKNMSRIERCRQQLWAPAGRAGAKEAIEPRRGEWLATARVKTKSHNAEQTDWRDIRRLTPNHIPPASRTKQQEYHIISKCAEDLLPTKSPRPITKSRTAVPCNLTLWISRVVGFGPNFSAELPDIMHHVFAADLAPPGPTAACRAGGGNLRDVTQFSARHYSHTWATRV
jgi:hypothetical protein